MPVHSEQTGCDFYLKGVYSPVGDEDTGDKVITTWSDQCSEKRRHTAQEGDKE